MARHWPIGRRASRGHIALACGLSLLCAAAPARAGAPRDIELEDGTHLRGEIVGVEGGAFRIRTDALGEVVVPETRVRSMSPATAPPGSSAAAAPAAGSSAGAPSTAGADAVQQAITANPAALQSVLALQDEPNVRAVLADPALMQAIQSNDLEAIARDPRIRALLEHPTVREISRGAPAP